jgi:hypothetical protein
LPYLSPPFFSIIIEKAQLDPLFTLSLDIDIKKGVWSWHRTVPYPNRLLKNAHLRRSPRPSSLQRTSEYASLLRISGALHLDIFDQPYKQLLFQQTAKTLRFKSFFLTLVCYSGKVNILFTSLSQNERLNTFP